jgi:hypothetical protein
MQTLVRSDGKRFDRGMDRGMNIDLDNYINEGFVLRAREGQDVAHATPSSPGPTTSRAPSASASQAAAQPAMREASGGTGEPAALEPKLIRSSHGRHRADTSVLAVAEQWQIANSRGSHRAGSSAASAPADAAEGLAATGPGVARSPSGRLGADSIPRAMAGRLPAEDSRRSQVGVPPQQAREFSAPVLSAIREEGERKVRFGVPGEEMFAERREFYPKQKPTVLGNPEKVLFTSDEVVKARPKSLPLGVGEEALANAVANDADKAARKGYFDELGRAVGHLQYLLAMQNPERVQQAIQRGTLPAEVLGDRLDPQFVEDVLDIHTQFQEAPRRAAALALGLPTFNDAGDLAKIIDVALTGRKSMAAALAQMAEPDATPSSPVPPVPQALNDNQIMQMTAALKGGGQALRRMSERAERANPKTFGSYYRRMVQTKPKPLEGARRTDFEALVDGDIAALATKLRIEPQHAADLLLRAVHTGQMGTHSLRSQDRALLLEVLAAKALNGATEPAGAKSATPGPGHPLNPG